MDFKKQINESVNGIHEIVKGKFIHQFRSKKYEKLIKEGINDILVKQLACVVSLVIEKATDVHKDDFNKECQDQYNLGVEHTKEAFKGFIPKPKTGFLTRIKFLFTGKI